ncbi:GerMN domain-containing protein, partial [Candidatus Parcubacteria bacterium]|nr:GerMN domain-containing protein [Candidatus Parcubacteria bacterium]
ILLVVVLGSFGYYLPKVKEKPKPAEIICAKEGEKVNRNPLLGPTDKKCCEDLFEWRESRSYSICLKPTKEGIIIESPKENELIKSPLKIKGKAKSSWFFEGQFLVQIYDKENNLLGSSVVKAKEDWTGDKFVSFEGDLEFSIPESSSGKLVFLSANPSGLPENQQVFLVNIRFEKEKFTKVLLYYYNPAKDKDESGNIKCSKDGLVPIEREIPITQTPIKDTIELLLRGKENLTEKEISQGITTEYPLEGFSLKSVNLKENGTLILEFQDPKGKTTGGSCRAKILWIQIEETAKQFPNVKRVEFLPQELFQP